ncbi:MAG: hypothetical protein PVI78_11020 [Anaerolineales bacterium]
MLNEQDLKALVAYRPGQPVLSVYLNADPSSSAADDYKLRLRQLLKQHEDNMPQDTEALIRFVEHEYDWSGRSLALFTCTADGFFRSFSLHIPLRDRARVHNRPYVKPLVDMWDNYGNYGVALVDKRGVRMFHFHLGELREEEGTIGEAVRHTKRGGSSKAPGHRGAIGSQTRYAEEITQRNLRESTKLATRFLKKNRVRRLLVGGTETTVARFVEELPKSWRSLLVGTFPMSFSSEQSQILKRAMQAAQKAEQQRQDQLVSTVITAAAKGREGVVRLDDTLSAVHEGRVQTLVIHAGFRAPGYRCRGCSFVTTQELKRCPFCGETFETIVDAVEHAVRRVIEDNGEVDVVHDSPELKQAGNIGGLLRY